jgi:hypothetical protein
LQTQRERIAKMLGAFHVDREVKQAIVEQINSGRVDSAHLHAVLFGLRIALDIIEEETDDREQRQNIT